ncbi:hypothetical protein SDC9_143569 [bioreactor metagenome]|uniref:Uncharacterized protein n=1 Tax=bioreactor metagenome TaxID=1076179 RepID=A0A645E4A1_9ZZZZ
MTGVERTLPLLIGGRPQPGEDPAAQRLHRTGGDDALRAAADAGHHVETRHVRVGGHHGGGDVAVGEQPGRRPRVADVGDQLLVAVAVEHADGDLVDRLALGLGDLADVLTDRGPEVDRIGRVRAHGELLHVEALLGVVHRSALGAGEQRDGVAHAPGEQAGAVHRVDRDVHRRAVAVAHLLAVGEHRRLVLLALADDDRAVDPDVGQHLAHGTDSGTVTGFLLAAAGPASRGQCGSLGGAHQVETEIVVGEHELLGSGVRHGDPPGHDEWCRSTATLSCPPGGRHPAGKKCFPVEHRRHASCGTPGWWPVPRDARPVGPQGEHRGLVGSRHALGHRLRHHPHHRSECRSR